MPAAEVSVPPELVRRLLAAQQPDLAHLPVRLIAHGWDNLMYRLGDELAVRLPRRAPAGTGRCSTATGSPALPARPFPAPEPAAAAAARPPGATAVRAR